MLEFETGSRIWTGIVDEEMYDEQGTGSCVPKFYS